MQNEKLTTIKKKALSDVKKEELSHISNSSLQNMLYLQFWLMYYINEYSTIEQDKLKRIAGEFEKSYGVVDLTMRREKKLKETLCKLAKGEDIDLTSEDCADFTYPDWREFADGLNRYFNCAADAAKNGRV